VCGIYDLATMPIYTAAKHALTGLTRSYGKLLPEEHIVLSAVAPNVVRTGIDSNPEFFHQLETKNILTPMAGLMEAFNEIINASTSGEVFECGPRGGWTKRLGMTYLDPESEESCRLLEKVAYGFH
jgi:NAD(P)-dependent dehydrogenase (short-subunit alcohol dehydrogenase family)